MNRIVKTVVNRLLHLLVLFPAWVGLPALAQVSAERSVELARGLMEMGDYALAVQYLNGAVKAKPYLGEPYYLRALAKYMLGDTRGGVEDCDEASRRNPYLYEPYRIKGDALMKEGDGPGALQAYNDGLKLNPDNPELCLGKGLALYATGDKEGCIEVGEAMGRKWPQYVAGKVYRSYFKWVGGRVSDALQELPALKSSSADELKMRIAILARCGDWPGVIESCDRLLDLQPRDGEVYAARAVAHRAAGEKDSYIADVSSARALGIEMHEQYDVDKFFPLAPVYKKDIKKHTPIERSGEFLGMYGLSFTHPDSELKLLSNASMALNELNAVGRFPSRLYLSCNADATPDAEQAVALFAYAEQGGRANGYALVGRGVAHAMLKDYESAVDELENAMSGGMANGLVHFELAYVLAQGANGVSPSDRHIDATIARQLRDVRLQRALGELDKAEKAGVEPGYVHYNKGVVILMLMADDGDDAVKEFERAIGDMPELGEAHYNLAVLLLKRGDMDRARKHLGRAGECGVTAAYRLLRDI